MSLEHVVQSKFLSVEYPQQTIGEYFRERICSQNFDLIALIDPITDYKLTYEQLDKKCNELSSALLMKNISKEDVILFFADNSIDYAVFMITAMYLGITFVPNVPADGPYELSSNIMACNANILVYGLNKNKVLEQIITNPKYSKINEQLKMIVQLDTIEPQPLLHNGKPISINVYSSKQLFNIGNGLCLSQIPYFPIEDLSNSKLFICFTSGTTGHSKGVIHSHHSFMATIQNFLLHEKHFGSTIGSPMPLGHISGTLCISKAISNAMTLVLFNNHNTEHIVKSIEKYRIAHLMVTSACLSDMAKENYHKLYDLSCLTQFQFIGSKPPSKLLKIVKEKYHVELLELYGSSEFLGIVNNSITCPELLFQEWESGNLGPLIANVEMKVIDLNTSVALPANQQGELCFRGKPCFVGYLNNLEATKTAIDSNEIVKFRIWSVFPAEIENFIQTVPSVKGVCVVGVPHVTDGYWLRAYVELADEEQNITEQWLTNFVAENMGFQKRLRGGVRFVDKIPRTQVGKIVRQYFKNLVKDELITEHID